jgi:hypothetical protein
MIHIEQGLFSFTAANAPSILIPDYRIPNENMMDTMPASHLVDHFTVKYGGYEHMELNSKGFPFEGTVPYGELYVKINQRLFDLQVQAWKYNEPEHYHSYVEFSPRFAISSTAAVQNDRRLKISKWLQSFAPALDRVIKQRTDELALDMARYWVEEYNKVKCYGPHTVEFVKTHETSHPTPGLTWAEVLSYGLMTDLWTVTQEVTETWSDKFDHEGNWCLSQQDIHFGNRQRSPKIRFKGYNAWKLDRCRQIGYATGVSSLNAFIKHQDKVRIIRHIFDQYEEVLDTKIICPKTEGGDIYIQLRNDFLAGKELVHFDVSGMEVITPSLIQGRKTHFQLGLGFVIGYLHMIPELLSGVSPTSDFDMIAHLEYLRFFFKVTGLKPLYIVILGDDCTMVFDKPIDCKEYPLYERQRIDDDMVRTLGLTTSEFMHPVGLNVTIDRADKRMSLRDLWGKKIYNKKDIPEREIIAELFTGFVNEVPLHELMGRMTPETEIYSPKDFVLQSLGIESAI